MTYFIVIFLSIFMFNLGTANAQSYTNTTNLFENNTSNYLINIAMTRKSDFLEHNFIIFQNDTNYYMIIFDDYTSNNNTLTFNNSFIIRYYREGMYNTTYQYQVYEESSTSFTASYVFISNLNINNSSGSSTYNELYNNRTYKYLLMLILGLIFASFLLKERSSY